MKYTHNCLMYSHLSLQGGARYAKGHRYQAQNQEHLRYYTEVPLDFRLRLLTTAADPLTTVRQKATILRREPAVFRIPEQLCFLTGLTSSSTQCATARYACISL